MKTGNWFELNNCRSQIAVSYIAIFICKINQSPMLLINNTIITSNNKFVQFVRNELNWTHFEAKRFIKQTWGIEHHDIHRSES